MAQEDEKLKQEKIEEVVDQVNSFFPQALWTGLGNLSPDQVEELMNPVEDVRQKMIDKMKKLQAFAKQSIDNLQNKTVEEVKLTYQQIVENTPSPSSTREQQRDVWRQQWAKLLAKRQQTSNQQQELMQQLQTALLGVVMQKCTNQDKQGEELCQTPNQQKTQENVPMSTSMDGEIGEKTTMKETIS